jgi:hypothetical protein
VAAHILGPSAGRLGTRIMSGHSNLTRPTDLNDLFERHEVRVRGRNQTVVFTADSEDGRLVIRQESDNKKPKETCAITLSNADELRAFFKGLRRIMASLGEVSEPTPQPSQSQGVPQAEDDRDALMARARQRNPHAFAPWTKEEEQAMRRHYEAGESIEAIARAHKRSPRAIELRLQRLGLMPAENGR